jgi:hypothetical protein
MDFFYQLRLYCQEHKKILPIAGRIFYYNLYSGRYLNIFFETDFLLLAAFTK